MSLLNFSDSSIDQLRTILGSYGNEQVGRLLKQSSSYVESLWFKVTEQVTITVEGEDDAFEYKAQQVRMDGTLASNGIIFDSEGTNTSKVDDPVYYDNLKINSELFTGAVEVDKAYQVEFIAPSSYEEKTQYYIIPKGGGGSTDFRLRMQSTILDINTPVQNGADIVTDLGEVIESDVTVIQRVFDTAQIYDEILFGYIDEEGYYCIDKSLLGV